MDTELASAAWVNGFVNSNPWGYTSAAQTITIASAMTLAQGLGARPTEVRVVIRCTTAQAPYAVGDEVDIGGTFESGAAPFGATAAADATNGIVRTGSSGNSVLTAAGAFLNITNASWRYIVRARL